MIRTLSHFGLSGVRDPRGTGVWVSGFKVAQVGIGCSKWITQHGFAINVTEECMPYFREIVPCGIDESVGGVACLEELAGKKLSVEEVAEEVVLSFEEEFGVKVTAET